MACITHHFACDCREARIRKLCEEVIASHTATCCCSMCRLARDLLGYTPELSVGCCYD